MVMGHCNFKGFNGVIYALHRNNEDFTISTKTKDGQEWEINHIDSKQLFYYLMYML